ncbi:MAG TPA: SpoIIE family protein phosphatase [Phycisphaerae bacterium]|nr:SpoIIE family protein phosphatase [Phycisphaerae bacterium]HRY70621.1 SpoIIE family protein phosphatase [Phycisphaerae bacterium]HSA28934.1 SpoIIE family protein phosphatase [Phycisphaerae bacterium]
MIEAREEDIDRITELFYRVLKGEIPQPLALPEDCPRNEVNQVAEYANRFIAEYRALADAMSALSRGELDFGVPAGKMHVLQSFKNLHANLRHLTWKTQQIAGGDLSQRVDFMGGFSTAFNSMTQQLRAAFAKIDRQNQDLSRANQRMKRDLEAAARVQQTLLPENLPNIEGLSFAWSYRPCDELAGDALNIVRINDDLIAVYCLDVSGHGVPAALLSVTVTRSLNPRAGGTASLVAGPGANPEAVDPVQVASRLNSLYPMESNGDYYFTMIYGLLDVRTRQFRFTVAAHPGPILAPACGCPRRFDVSGFPIGMVEDADYEQSVIDLRPGDRLFLHSDGLTEEANAQGELFGDERLLGAIEAGRHLGLSEVVESLIRTVAGWRGDDHLRDDVSILAIGLD